MSSDPASASDYIKGKDNPQSLVNITPSVLSSRLATIPDDILMLSDEELEQQGSIHETERKMRIAWQLEYERATRTSTDMMMSNVYRGLVTHQYFTKYVMNNAFKLAYIIRPFAEYKAELADLFNLLTKDMREIIKYPVIDQETGKMDYKAAAIKKAIWEGLADRLHGAAAKKLEVESKSMNVNINKDVSNNKHDLEAIDRKLAELEASEVQQISYKDVSDGSTEREV